MKYRKTLLFFRLKNRIFSVWNISEIFKEYIGLYLLYTFDTIKTPIINKKEEKTMKKMKKLLAVLLSLSMVLGMITVTAQAEGEVAQVVTHGYDNLNNEEGDLVIGFIGGSITIGSNATDRYATHVTNWFQEQYPNKNVTQVNAGMSGTPSNMGKYRLYQNIGQYAPDVVFIEFAVNDAGGYSEVAIRENIESMIRQLQALPKQPVIVMLYSYQEDEAGIEAAMVRDRSMPAQRTIAKHYNIAEVCFFDYMNEKVDAGEYVWYGSLSNDKTHPNAKGHVVYADYITSKLAEEGFLTRQEKTHTQYSYRLFKNPHCKLSATANR